MIGVIGCGKVGLSFSRYLKKNGIEVSGFYDTDIKKAVFCGQDLKVEVFPSIQKLLVSSKIIMVTVPDDNIIKVWKSIKGLNLEGKTIFHTSGSLSTDVFSESRNCFTASLHPMMTFLGEEEDTVKMKEITFAYEGDAPLLEEILINLGNSYFKVAKKDKVRYHLAGVYASNILIPVITRGIENLRSCGLETNKAREILLPLVEKTIENIYIKGSREAVTGPIERGDIKTIEKHLRCQSKHERALYIEGSRELLKILERKDKKIEELLEEYS